MANKEGHRSSPVLLGICIFSFLVFLFGRYIPTSSFDLVQHFLLVDEIAKHAMVRPESVQRISAMALYPAAAHWAAAVIGWITGSGLVGITIITIASAYLCYLFIAYLIGASTPANVLLFALAFLALRFTRSQIGCKRCTSAVLTGAWDLQAFARSWSVTTHGMSSSTRLIA